MLIHVNENEKDKTMKQERLYKFMFDNGQDDYIELLFQKLWNNFKVVASTDIPSTDPRSIEYKRIWDSVQKQVTAKVGFKRYLQLSQYYRDKYVDEGRTVDQMITSAKSILGDSYNETEHRQIAGLTS